MSATISQGDLETIQDWDGTRKTIVITGVTGQVAEVIAAQLSQRHHIVGLARFTDEAARLRLEACGVECISTDLLKAEFEAIPTGVDAVLNFAVVKSQRWEVDLRANAQAAGLLMAHTQPKVFFQCSSTGVYAAAGSRLLDESSPLGDNHAPIMPTYSISKIAAEEVVRTMCRHQQIPTIIARLNVPYGVGPLGEPRGWPAFHLAMMQAGMAIPVEADQPNLFNPINLVDIAASIPALLEAATVPATVLNWAGAEQVSLEEWCEFLADRCGLTASFEVTDSTIGGVTVDTSKMQSICGATKVSWQEGFAALADAHLAGQDSASDSAGGSTGR
ncbi:MAG: NAD(P)-dependent oxidoreductase [Actinomycetes bacterium]